MGQLRYIPKHFMERPDWFGRRDDSKWESIPDNDPVGRAQLAASYFQHKASLEAQKIADEQQMPLAVFAGSIGMLPATLRRKLNGDVPARVEEILAWALLLGLEVLPAPSSTEELLPPT